jgi:hypothetical protein
LLYLAAPDKETPHFGPKFGEDAIERIPSRIEHD